MPGENANNTHDARKGRCTVVYIHGIGNKPEPWALKKRWDTALFQQDMGDRTRFAYWADILYDEPLGAQEGLQALSLPDSPEAGFRDSDLTGWNADYERAIHEAMLNYSEDTLLDADEEPAGGGGMRPLILPTRFLRRRVTRLVTGLFIRDTEAYFFHPELRAAIRDRLRALLPPSPDPYVVVSHSQGTIIAYDVLRELSETNGVQCALWLTLGSPLGIREVQDQLNQHDHKNAARFSGMKVPGCVAKWVNVADRLDIVALDRRLANNFKPKNKVTDHRVRNPERWTLRGYGAHSDTGYLSVPETRDAVRKAVGERFTGFVNDFVIAKDLARDIHGMAAPLPVLIELDERVEGESLDEKRQRVVTRLQQLLKKRAPRGRAPKDAPLGVTPLRRFVAAALTPHEIAVLSAENAALKINRIWRDSQKTALIAVSKHVVHAFPAHHGYLATGEGIHWAVLDTGIQANHPHFRAHGTIASAWDCTQWGIGPVEERKPVDPSGHGTHVAGIIAGEAAGKDGQVYAGMAPMAKLHAYKVLDDRGFGNDSYIIKALDHIADTNERAGRLVIHGVNLSLGGPFNAEVYGCGHSPICNELRRLWRQGVVVCIAAGNEGQLTLQGAEREVSVNLDLSIGDPANLEEAIAVGSVHRDKPHVYGPSFFSSRGPTADGRMKPDLVAPGEQIVSCNSNFTRKDDWYIPQSGTSMACPHVSGIVAAFLSVRSEFIGFPDRVKAILLEQCTTLDRAPAFQGHGLPNLIKMLTAT